MLHQQNPTILFDLSRDQHERLLQAATQQRLLKQVTSVATPANLFLQWLRGQSQTAVIQKIPAKATPAVN